MVRYQDGSVYLYPSEKYYNKGFSHLWWNVH